MCAQTLVGQIASFPHTQSFEQVFITGTDVEFIADWQGNTIATSNRIFQGSAPRSGNHSLNIIPISSFSGEILISLDLTALQGASITFFAYSQQNSASATRPALLSFSTSIDGGLTYSDDVQIGDETTFPNNNLTTYQEYEYELPSAAANEANVIVKMVVKRGPGSGAAAELIMDDFTIQEKRPSLQVEQLTFVNPTELEVRFNQAVEKASAEKTVHYSMNYGFGRPLSAERNDADPAKIRLLYDKPFYNNTYELTLDSIFNIDRSSLLNNTSISEKHVIQTFKNQLMINEIYADPMGTAPPDPIVLPSSSTAEYVELYNATDEAIEITDFSLSGGIIQNHTIEAKDYVILTAPRNVSTYQAFGRTAAVSGWNTLTNSGESLTLYDQLGNPIDSLHYNTLWYKNDAKAEGGWSLERINPIHPCSGPDNWNASIDNQGGTPGAINSIFDDLPDEAPPEVLSFKILTDSTFLIDFNEYLDESTAIPSNFEILPTIRIKKVTLSESGTQITIHTEAAIMKGSIYQLSMQGIKDCSGNAMARFSFELAVGRTPNPYELIITEIMANPEPAVGLPESEYLEIYNNTTDLLSIKNMIYADALRSTQLPNRLIRPGEYLVLVPIGNIDQFDANAIGLSKWPSINNREETVRLFNEKGTLIHEVSFKDSWYRSSLRSDGGYSLEMIDLNFPCVEEFNWIASSSPSGGTPGMSNASNGKNPDHYGPKINSAFIVNSTTLHLLYSEKLNLNSIDLSDFTIENGPPFIGIKIDETSKTIELYLAEDLAENTVYLLKVENIADCSGNLIDKQNNEIELVVPGVPETQDVLINEILFNPRSGSSRFVELYNHSAKYLNLKNWTLFTQNAEKVLANQDLFLSPFSFLVITDDIEDVVAQYPGAQSETFVELSAMPSMRSDSGTIGLRSPDKIVIDQLFYEENFQSPLLSNLKGVSLERISLDIKTNNPENWHSASEVHNYGTPGYANSQSRSTPVSDNTLVIDPPVITPNLPGIANFATLNFTFKNTGNVLNIFVYDASGRLIKRIAQNSLIGTSGFYTWDGTTDEQTRARIGYYMVLVEIINPNGSVIYLKDKIAVAGRF